MAKLVLELDIAPDLIEQIKTAAKAHKESLTEFGAKLFLKGVEVSDIVEKKPFKMKSLEELPDWIKELTISGDPVPDFDHKAEYHKHLEEKYGI